MAVQKNFYLITESGFARQLLQNLLYLTAAVGLAFSIVSVRELVENHLDAAKHLLLTGPHRLVLWSVIGLLSSSCYVLQILLNAFSVECAGCNTRLGSARASFLAVTLLLQIACWTDAYSRPSIWPGHVASTLLCGLLSLSPELIHAFSWIRHKIPTPPSTSDTAPTDVGSVLPPALTTPNTLTAVITGLLGSSCCLLQLGINALSAANLLHNVGCAGFNNILGPLRPPLRAATTAWLIKSWVSATPGPRRRSLLAPTLLCVALTLMPEALLYAGTGVGVVTPVGGARVLRLRVEGMGCEACQMHVQGFLERTEGVVSASVDFESGEAEVYVKEGEVWDQGAVNAALQDDGYELVAAS